MIAPSGSASPFPALPQNRSQTPSYPTIQTAVRDYVENAKKTPILILDESQCLPDKTLDEIPVLLNFRMDSIDPLLMIMIGPFDLGRRLGRPMFRNIHQRILRWPRLVGQLGGLFKMYSYCHSYRQKLLGQIFLSLLLRL